MSRNILLYIRYYVSWIRIHSILTECLDCTGESRKNLPCLQFKVKKHCIITWKITLEYKHARKAVIWQFPFGQLPPVHLPSQIFLYYRLFFSMDSSHLVYFSPRKFLPPEISHLGHFPPRIFIDIQDYQKVNGLRNNSAKILTLWSYLEKMRFELVPESRHYATVSIAKYSMATKFFNFYF